MTIIYKTINTNGMNTRPDHNVSNSPNGSVAYGREIVIVEVWTATTDGHNVRKGDVWARLEGDVNKWVAVVHFGKVYGELFNYETPPPVEPPVTVEFPQSYILTDNDPKSPNYGKRAEYIFSKVL